MTIHEVSRILVFFGIKRLDIRQLLSEEKISCIFGGIQEGRGPFEGTGVVPIFDLNEQVRALSLDRAFCSLKNRTFVSFYINLDEAHRAQVIIIEPLTLYEVLNNR